MLAQGENVFASCKIAFVAERESLQGNALFKMAAAKVTISVLFLRVPETPSPILVLQTGEYRARHHPQDWKSLKI